MFLRQIRTFGFVLLWQNVPLPGARKAVTPSDTSMPVGRREWHQYFGVCGKQQRDRGGGGKGLSARKRCVFPEDSSLLEPLPPNYRRTVTIGDEGAAGRYG